MHRRVPGREPERRRVLGQLVEAQRPRVPDELPEHAVALGQAADLVGQVVVDAHDEKLGKSFAVIADDTERAVLRVDQRGGDLGDAAQDRLQVQVAPDSQDSLEQAALAVAAGE